MFGKRVGFIKFEAKIIDSEGTIRPGIVFMRGGSVAVLVDKLGTCIYESGHFRM